MVSSRKVLDKKNKDVMDYKSCLNFIKCEDRSTFVFILVSHFQSEKNDLNRLKCKELLSINGYPNSYVLKPLNNGYVYDSVNDTYLVRCVDLVSLGTLPFHFKINLNNVGLWENLIPIPDKILIRTFNKDQKLIFDTIKEEYPDDFSLNFIQFLVDNEKT